MSTVTEGQLIIASYGSLENSAEMQQAQEDAVKKSSGKNKSGTSNWKDNLVAQKQAMARRNVEAKEAGSTEPQRPPPREIKKINDMTWQEYETHMAGQGM